MKRMASLLSFLLFAIMSTFCIKASAEVIASAAIQTHSMEGVLAPANGTEPAVLGLRTSEVLFPNVFVLKRHCHDKCKDDGKDVVKYALRLCLTESTADRNVDVEVRDDAGNVVKTLTVTAKENGCVTFTNIRSFDGDDNDGDDDNGGEALVSQQNDDNGLLDGLETGFYHIFARMQGTPLFSNGNLHGFIIIILCCDHKHCRKENDRKDWDNNQPELQNLMQIPKSKK